MNTNFDINEYHYAEYEKYLANKRANTAPQLGSAATNLTLSFVTLGLTEAADPRSDYSPKSVESVNVTPDRARKFGGVSLSELVSVQDNSRHEALAYANQQEYDLAV